jgi:hypothetical protein
VSITQANIFASSLEVCRILLVSAAILLGSFWVGFVFVPALLIPRRLRARATVSLVLSWPFEIADWLMQH